VLDELVSLMSGAAGAVDYADCRWVATERELLTLRNGRVARIDSDTEEGVGVRVRHGGAWGFAATAYATGDGLRRALQRALAVARAQPPVAASPLAPVSVARGHWAGPCDRDPLAVGLEAKLDLLGQAEAGLRSDPRIVRSEAHALAIRTRKAFASTEGGACTQELTECGGSLAAYALQDDELQTRSYPAAHGGSTAAGGWELVEALDLTAAAPRVADEALALLSAPPCPAGPTTVILDAEQLALQLHESVGHALELDRMLGGEASYAGTSWVGPRDVGSLRYGSPAMTVVADATLAGALGSFGWDDEGVPARVLTLVEEGILRSALSSRESATAIGEPASGGCMRADGWARQPIVRMTNVSLAPGQAGSLEELVADTGDGLLLSTNRSWSIDHRRLHFQFGCELAREIRDGRLGRLYRNPVYAGVTPQFWAGLDAVCSASEWRVHGLLNCGKGEPAQVAHVSHGTAPARFRDVDVRAA